jgi:hypothetical protein
MNKAINRNFRVRRSRLDWFMTQNYITHVDSEELCLAARLILSLGILRIPTITPKITSAAGRRRSLRPRQTTGTPFRG